MSCVIATGSPFDGNGISLIGPFDDEEAALQWAKHRIDEDEVEFFIVALLVPGG